ncbi:MAG: hypothetical protein AAGD43_07475 [Pseudomonadota bacterium]
MSNGIPRQPDYSVKSSEKYLDDKKQVKYRSTLIGVGWINTDDKGEERINVKLHALPVSGELVLWKYEPYQELPAPELAGAEA